MQKNLELLQLFRGIAAISVLLFHANGVVITENFGKIFAIDLFNQGFSGVDFFFILSGFIIYYAHHRDFAKPIKFHTYIAKRFTRIYPIHWVATTLMFAAFILNGSAQNGQNFVNSPANIISSYLLIPNTEFINGVSWTLSHEILFYLMFSLLILFPKKISYIIFSIWAFISVFTFLLPTTINQKLFLFIFSSYNIEFIVGVCIAYLVINNKLKGYSSILLLGIVLLILSWSIQYQNTDNYNRIIYYGVPYAIIVLGAAGLSYNKDVKIPKLFKYLGDASYSIYLFHLLFLLIINKVFQMFSISSYIGSTLSIVVIILCTLLFSCLSYTFIEKPLLTYCRRTFITRKKSKPIALHDAK